MGSFQAQMIKQRQRVVHLIAGTAGGVDFLGGVGLAIAPLVRSDTAKT